jgi:putative transposase
LAAVRYILLNPVKAKLVEYPWDYKWSSTRHHLGIEKGKLVTNGLINTLIGDWKEFLRADTGKSETDLFELHERTGKPLGDIDFTEKLEKILSRSLKRKKPGPKVEKH